VTEVLSPLWSQVAGKALAKESRPVAFSAGTLTLAITNPDWAVPVRQMADEIRARINSFLGGPLVKHLRIECAAGFTRGDRSRRQPESLAIAEPAGVLHPRPTVGVAQTIGRSRVKFVARKHGKID